MMFEEVLLDLVDIYFRNCETSIDPGHRRTTAGDAFDVGNVPFERSPSAAESPRSVSCDLANVNKQIAKFLSTIRIVWSSSTMCLTLTSATCRLSYLLKPLTAVEPPPSAAELPAGR